MKTRHVFVRIVGLSIVCSACLWFLMHNIPAMFAQDDSTQKKEIVDEVDNKTEEFTDPYALYRRSAISSALHDVQSNIPDQPGAVQLMPVGSLTPFTTTNTLPRRITDMGVVALGKYIYVIGGNIRPTRNDEQPVSSNEVIIGTVNQQDGSIVWDLNQDKALPSVRFSSVDMDGYDESIADVSFMATTAVETEDNSGYIYVIGGIVSPKAFDDKQVSSAAVHIGVVQDGAIVEWKQGPMLINPNPEVPETVSYGIESAAATHVRIGGRTFVYLFGGKHISYNPDNDKETIDPMNIVFYAEVDEETGDLLKPGTTQPGWARVSSIPTPDGAKAPSAMGLWYTTVVQGAAADTTNNYAIYLIGGQRRVQEVTIEEDPHKYSNVVYRARVSSEGTLTWDWQGLLPGNALYNLSGAQFNGNIYVTGGVPVSGAEQTSPRKDVMYSYINDDLTLLDGADSFITVPEDDVEHGALPLARAKHGTVVVPSVNPDNAGTLAYVYVIGGVSGTGDDNVDPDDDYSYNGTNTVFFSRIDPEEAEKIYPSDGWYYSRLHNVEDYLLEDKTTLTGVYWSALISRTEAISTDIRLEYRIDTKPEGCNASQLFEKDGKEMPWTPLVITEELSSTQSITRTFKGNGSQFGPNDADLADEHLESEARCLQYRAQLIRDEEDLTHTPVLLNVGVQFIADKRPNLYVDRIDPQFLGAGEESQKLVGLDLTVKNLNGDMVNTADANFDGGDEKHIYLDLFILAPEELGILDDMQNELQDAIPVFGSGVISIPSTLHLWNTIPKDAMSAGETYPNDQNYWKEFPWKYVGDPDGEGEIKAGDKVLLTDALADIGKTGTYTVCLAVDSYVSKGKDDDDSVKWPNGYVNEAIETDNAKCVEIEVEKPPIEVWVVAEDKEAGEDEEVAEDTTIEGTFVITREGGSLSLPLSVTFQLEGRAQFGDPTQTGTGDDSLEYDYEFKVDDGIELTHKFDVTANATKHTITIPADKESVTIRLVPYDDDIYEPREKATLKLLAEDDARYGLVGTEDRPDEDAVFIEDNDPMGIYLPLILK